MGVITNLPADLTADQGKDMVVYALISQDPATSKLRTIGEFIPRDNIVTNHEAGGDKPDPKIYQFAAKKLGVEPHECLFIGENLIENLGAALAGMGHQLKPCPPGREFLPALQTKSAARRWTAGANSKPCSSTSTCSAKAYSPAGRPSGKSLRNYWGKARPLDQGKWISPSPVKGARRAFSRDRLLCAFDRPFRRSSAFYGRRADDRGGVACGMDPKAPMGRRSHEQARAYWRVLDVAWRRIQKADSDDRFYAYRLPTGWKPL